MVGHTPTRVMTVEHLMAIALKTGRANDFGRIALLLEEADVDYSRLQEILGRHGLLGAWDRFRGRAEGVLLSRKSLKRSSEKSARRHAARLPIEEKLRILVRLEEHASLIRRATGRPEKCVWRLD